MVPTTPTFTDSLAKNRELAVETAALIHQRDGVLLSIEEAKRGLDYLSSKNTEILSAIDSNGNSVAEVAKMARETIDIAKTLVLEANTIAELSAKAALELETRITKGKADLAAIEVYKRNALDEMARERQGLEQTRADLDIYKGRLEKKIQEAGVDIKIIL